MIGSRVRLGALLAVAALALSADGAAAAISMQVVDSEIDDITNINRYMAIAPMDIDGDGLPDVVTTGEVRNVSEWRYARPTASGAPNLDGRLTRPGCGSCQPSPVDGLVSRTIGGKPYLLTFDPGQTEIEFWSTRNGVWLQNSSTVLVANVQSAAIGDPNGDGLPDAVVLLTTGAVSVIPTMPDGETVAFDTPNTIPLGTVAGTPVAVRMANVTGLPTDDVVVLTGGAGTALRVAEATASSPPTFSPFTSGAVPAGPLDFELADFDGDGLKDVLLGTSTGVSIARNETGTGGPVVGVTSTRTFNVIPDVAAADVDGDGTPEVAAAEQSTLGIGILDVVGTAPSAPEIFFTVNSSNLLIAADLDGDGADEVVVAGRGIDVLTNNAPGAASAAPTSAALGTVEVGRVGAPVGIAVTNQREGTERVRSVSVEGSAPFDVLVADGCSSAGVLVPGEQCTLTARLSPTASGTRSASVRVDLAHAPDLVIPVSGEGVAASAGPPGTDGAQGPAGVPGPAGPAGPTSTVRAAVLTTTKCARSKRTKVKCTLRLAARSDVAGRVRLLVGKKTAGRARLAARATTVSVSGTVPATRRKVVVELALPGLAAQRVTVAVPRGARSGR